MGGNWCASFVSWCANEAEVLSTQEGGVVPKFTSCIAVGATSGIAYYARNNRLSVIRDIEIEYKSATTKYYDEIAKYSDYYDPTYVPNMGDTVFFRWTEGTPAVIGEFHVGIVYSLDSTSKNHIYSIEGNTSGYDGFDSNLNSSPVNGNSVVTIRRRNKSQIFAYGRNSG